MFGNYFISEFHFITINNPAHSFIGNDSYDSYSNVFPLNRKHTHLHVRLCFSHSKRCIHTAPNG